MTSPLRFEADMSMIEGEKLSPIKIPHSRLSTTTKSPDILAKHPHGLSAKHDARRNTVHNETPKGLTATPLTKKAEPLYSVNKRAPLTSPRAANQPNLDSLKKSKTKLDARLYELKSSSRHGSPSNKENLYNSGRNIQASQLSSEVNSSISHKSPFESSPSKIDTPIKQINSSLAKDVESSPPKSSPSKTDKRSIEDSTIENSRKIAKVITNANESEISHHNSDDEHLVQIDQVFNKEDLVGRFSSGASPAKLQEPTVIDEDSDGDIYNNEVNTSHTTLSKFRGNESTQLSRIIKITDEVDYVTPQRYTEPIAKSPETNQQHRIQENIPDNNGLKEAISPLKNHRLSVNNEQNEDHASPNKIEDENSDLEFNELEDEPTINFLLSPNSKPVFSLDHIKKVQDDHFKEVVNLEEVINNKNQEILRFSEELSATNNKFLIYDQKIKELKQDKKKLAANENLLLIQLKHNERELASMTKALRIKENNVTQLESRLSKSKSKCESIAKNLESVIQEGESLREHIKKLEKSVEDKSISQKEYETQIKTLDDEIKAKNSEISSLTDANIDYNIKVENLLSEKEELLNETERLGRENNGLEEINSKQQELLEELDKLENLAKDKITNLESTLDAKVREIKLVMTEKDELLTKLDRITEETKILERELQQSKTEIEDLTNKLNNYNDARNELNDNINGLQKDLDKSNEANKALQNRVNELIQEIEKLNQNVSESETQVDLLKSINTEKDEIISGDTKKMGELVQKVNKQKQIIADYEKDYSKALEDIKSLQSESKDSSLNEQVEDLKKQVSEGQAKTNARIQEVAEQLYFEYSKKHELKVNQVRASFKKQIDNLHFEKKSQARDIDSLQKKLEIVNMEKNQLLRLIDEYQSGSDPSSKKKLSPKKSGIKKPLRY
ncbi:Autophagy-related protein 23 [Debaryomyces fabryi]|uniref:Autophagy-related protein 23 n=1 Tax=Debaryomyces fabryi TaxID=58627 RepID=A0A0V1Q5S7_9ASCO|nr:Autophagy-related protein 23 [Debaryomyces fabryi]KSA03567.1 Autophagy-related protein 23 [Debaryomyces fabryi]CUM54288.1 unnamed protein product [Debaryomyces fabryi]